MAELTKMVREKKWQLAENWSGKRQERVLEKRDVLDAKKTQKGLNIAAAIKASHQILTPIFKGEDKQTHGQL